ncbi:MAG TPA: hypothetical protein VEB86_01875 [Chryseosolibacter sp.]|nr:hypothetical protein [Chryseosolibacter sp.]
MKYLLILLFVAGTSARAQITMDIAYDSAVRKYHIGSYTYHEDFKGHRGYGAPLILTADGGAAAFGGGDEGAMLVKLGKTGKLEWKRTVKPKGDEMEPQSVVEDSNGNFYVFILVYDRTKYRGGTERVVFFNKTGTPVWDKYLGSFTLLNNPTVDYIKAAADGRIALRGHVVREAPEEGKDPSYLFWEAWLDSQGGLTEKTGEVIDWANPEWKKKFSPE